MKNGGKSRSHNRASDAEEDHAEGRKAGVPTNGNHTKGELPMDVDMYDTMQTELYSIGGEDSAPLQQDDLDIAE